MERNNEYGITQTAANLTPVAVCYNITGDLISSFVMNYLSHTKGIDGVEAVELEARKTPKGPVIDAFVIINSNSSEIQLFGRNGGAEKVNPRIQKNLDNSSYRTSQKLNQTLRVISNDTTLHSDGKSGLLVVELDIFRILSLMLACVPKKHKIAIRETKVEKRGIIMNIMKMEDTTNRGKEKYDKDKYAKIIGRVRR